MRATFFVLFTIVISLCHGQNLNGQYVFHPNEEVFYEYIFISGQRTFSAIRAADVGTFYGEGTFEVKGGQLILNFDSTGVYKSVDKGFRDLAVRQGGLYIIHMQEETLTMSNVKKNKFDLECDYTGQMETFTRPKRVRKTNQGK
jgi:hypothetical protein